MRRLSQQGPDRRIHRRVFVVLGMLCLGVFSAVTVHLLRDMPLGTPADDALRAAAASTTPQVMADAGVPSVPPATPGASPIQTPRTYSQCATHGYIHGHATRRTHSHLATSTEAHGITHHHSVARAYDTIRTICCGDRRPRESDRDR